VKRYNLRPLLSVDMGAFGFFSFRLFIVRKRSISLVFFQSFKKFSNYRQFFIHLVRFLPEKSLNNFVRSIRRRSKVFSEKIVFSKNIVYKKCVRKNRSFAKKDYFFKIFWKKRLLMHFSERSKSFVYFWTTQSFRKTMTSSIYQSKWL